VEKLAKFLLVFLISKRRSWHWTHVCMWFMQGELKLPLRFQCQTGVFH